MMLKFGNPCTFISNVGNPRGCFFSQFTINNKQSNYKNSLFEPDVSKRDSLYFFEAFKLRKKWVILFKGNEIIFGTVENERMKKSIRIIILLKPS